MTGHHDFGITQVTHPHDADAAIRKQMTDCWIAVSNAGGVAGFPFPPVNARQVAPAVDHLASRLDPQQSRILLALDSGTLTGWVAISRDANPLIAHWGTVNHSRPSPSTGAAARLGADARTAPDRTRGDGPRTTPSRCPRRSWARRLLHPARLARGRTVARQAPSGSRRHPGRGSHDPRPALTRGTQTVAISESARSDLPRRRDLHHRAFIARRRTERPSEEYRDLAATEWDEFLAHGVRVSDASTTCTVRIARPEDLAAVLQVHSAPGDSTPGRPSDLHSRTWARMMESDDLTIYLAEVDGRPAGTATMMTMPNLTYRYAPTAFIEAVVVAATHRRQGIATKIMGRILSDARAAGCNKVQLSSHKRHAGDGAHRLYTSLGFHAEAEGFRLDLREIPAAVKAAQAGGP